MWEGSRQQTFACVCMYVCMCAGVWVYVCVYECVCDKKLFLGTCIKLKQIPGHLIIIT